MRNLKMVLAMVAILAMASTSFADLSYDVVSNPSPGLGLDSYTVLMGGAKTFTNVNIFAADENGDILTGVAGVVHQVNEFGGFPAKAQKTLWLGLMAPESEPFDTHFMFAYDAGQLGIGNIATETSTKNSSPTGVVTDEYGFYYGLGSLTSAVTDGFALSSVLAEGTPFMQIVVPTGTAVWLTGGAVVGTEDVQFSILVPEPGTIMLVIAGALCLLVARYRRK